MRSSNILLQPTAVIALLASASGAVPDTPQFRRPECGDRTSDKFFFPEGWVGAKTAQFDQDEFARHWYSGALRTASEPSLSCDPAPHGETYRFLRLRPFDTPMFVRVEARDDGGVALGVNNGVRKPEDVPNCSAEPDASGMDEGHRRSRLARVLEITDPGCQLR